MYAALAELVVPSDAIVTFNYDVALEQKLIEGREVKFRVKDGYGFEAKWSEPESPLKVLKLHGSVNWIALLFGGTPGFGAAHTSLGHRPFVDNSDAALPNYPSRVLGEDFRRGGVAPGSISLILMTHDKRYSVTTSLGEEWAHYSK